MTVTLTRTDAASDTVTAVTRTGPPSDLPAISERGEFFDTNGIPPGTYTVRATLTAFVPSVRESVAVAVGEALRLDLVAELAPLEPDMFLREAAADEVRAAAAIVRIRFIEAIEATLKSGVPTTEHRVSILDVVKPYVRPPASKTTLSRPLGPVVRGDVLPVLQFDAGEATFEQRLLQGRNRVAQAGDEYIALLRDVCRGVWAIDKMFAVSNDRVMVPSAPGTGWDQSNRATVGRFSRLMRELAREP